MTTIQPTFDDFVAWLEGIRPAGPVQFDDKLQCWQVLGHPETGAVLSDPAGVLLRSHGPAARAGGLHAVPARQLRADGPAAAPQAADAGQPGLHARGSWRASSLGSTR